MTPDAFRAALLLFGLNQQGCADFLDVDVRTVRRWAQGDVAIPRSVAISFALMARFKVPPDDLRS